MKSLFRLQPISTNASSRRTLESQSSTEIRLCAEDEAKPIKTVEAAARPHTCRAHDVLIEFKEYLRLAPKCLLEASQIYNALTNPQIQKYG
jgi:hypothetical protein